MSEMTIVTNNVPRDILDAYELTAEERAEFDYLEWDSIEAGEDSASFFRYKGQLYDLGEFSTSWGLSATSGLPEWLKGWDGYMTDSYFSGMAIKFVEDNERVVVARFFN